MTRASGSTRVLPYWVMWMTLVFALVLAMAPVAVARPDEFGGALPSSKAWAPYTETAAPAVPGEWQAAGFSDAAETLTHRAGGRHLMSDTLRGSDLVVVKGTSCYQVSAPAWAPYTERTSNVPAGWKALGFTGAAGSARRAGRHAMGDTLRTTDLVIVKNGSCYQVPAPK